jgi:peroxiredoxin
VSNGRPLTLQPTTESSRHLRETEAGDFVKLSNHYWLLLLVSFYCASADTVKGLQPGVQAPSFSLQDQDGKQQNLSTLTGSKGLLLLFFRSADWCPFCKGQLVDLEGMQKAFAAKGIAVAAVSYDSPAILSSFATRRSITYPLLSDMSSSLIDAFGIRNNEATGMQTGIPYPGYYLIDPHGVIEKRFFENSFYNRLTASSLYNNLFGTFLLPVPSKTLPATPYVTIQTIQSDAKVTPGAVIQLAVAITPGPDTHIYAPGAEKLNYHVASLVIHPSSLYTATAIDYPTSEMMSFPELAQTVPVYTGRTILTTSVAAIINSQTLTAFAARPELSIKGAVTYQACTSKVCFPPTTVPVEWDIALLPLDRTRAPEAMQHK